nr:MAG: hypothetical protein [Bacteriophage sp.]
MFGLKIVKSSYINTLKQDLDEAISYSSRLKRNYEDARSKITELEEKERYLNTLVDSLDMDIESKDSHIVKMGNELSKSRDLYNESVKEKETLKRAYMDIEKKHKLSSKLLDEARRRYKEIEEQNKAMSDRIQYLENHIDPEALDGDVSDEVIVEEDKMDPNSGHIDIPENNASEITDADAGNDVNIENKTEEKKKSKKRKNLKRMNKILLLLITILTLAVVGCSTSRTYYTEYDTTDISYVVDSIVSSGTVMGQWKEWRFTLDDGRVDNFGFTALYDAKGKARGSIQVRQRSDTFNIKIIDYHKKDK